MQYTRILGSLGLFLSLASPALAVVAPPLPTAVVNGSQTTSNQAISANAKAAIAASNDALNGLGALAVAAKNGDKVTAGTALVLVKESAASAASYAALAAKGDTAGGRSGALANAASERAQTVLKAANQVYAAMGAQTSDPATNAALSQLLTTIAGMTKGTGSTMRPNTYVKPGSNKRDVLKLQIFLMQKGYLKVGGTGLFGPATTAALKAFQKSKGIQQTGSVGPSTLGAITNAN